MLERNVARPICLVFFAVADKGETHCDEAEHGGLEFDGLDMDQHQYAKEVRKETSLASSIAVFHCRKCVRTRARLAST